MEPRPTTSTDAEPVSRRARATRGRAHTASHQGESAPPKAARPARAPKAPKAPKVPKSPKAPRERVELTDPKAIRAIAHPARMIVIDALYDQGIPLTATQAAELAGITPSAMSYHLRALSRFGIITPAPDSVDGRERPWVRAAKSLAIRPSASMPSTAGAAATGAVLSVALDRVREMLIEATNRIATTERLPLDVATGFGNLSVVVTPDEAVELMKKIDELLEELRIERRSDAPAEAGRLNLTIIAVPDPAHPGTAVPDTIGS